MCIRDRSTASGALQATKTLSGSSGGVATATVDLSRNHILICDAGIYEITGAVLSPEVGRKLACDAGVYAITGIAADLTYSGGVTAIYGDGWHMFQLMSQN